MKRLLFISLMFPALCFIGCGSVPPEVDEPLSIADELRLGNAVLAAVKKRDYKAFARNLSRKAGIFPAEKDFILSCGNMAERFGKLVSYRFALDLKTPGVRNLVWVLSFERKASDGGTTRREMLFRIVTGRLDGRPHIISMGLV